MHKKLSLLVLAIMVFSMQFIGCTKIENQVVVVDDEATNKVNITFFANQYEEINVRVIEEIITDYMTENTDICVNYESLKGIAYYEALVKRLASGNGDDVFMVEHDTYLRLKQNDYLEDLSGLDVVSKYNDLTLSQIVDENGLVYMLPTKISMYGLYCNMDLLRENNQAVPQNLEQWRSVCDYFVDKGITPIIANNDISLKTMATGIGFYDIYINKKEEECFEKLNKGNEKLSDYLKAGFEIAEEFIKKGYIDAETALKTEKTSDDLAQFIEGNNPFMLTGAWATERIAEKAPELNFEVYPLPILKDGNLTVINVDNCLAVNKNSNNKNMALSFVKYFTKEENIKKFANQQCSICPIESGEEPDSFQVKPLLEAFNKDAYVFGGDSRLKSPIWKYGEEISKKLLKGEDCEKVMDWLKETEEKAFLENNLNYPQYIGGKAE